MKPTTTRVKMKDMFHSLLAFWSMNRSSRTPLVVLAIAIAITYPNSIRAQTADELMDQWSRMSERERAARIEASRRGSSPQAFPQTAAPRTVAPPAQVPTGTIQSPVVPPSRVATPSAIVAPDGLQFPAARTPERLQAAPSTGPAGQGASDILFLGDSHSAGCFGQTLDRRLRSVPLGSGAPARVFSEALVGAAPRHFLPRTDMIETGARNRQGRATTVSGLAGTRLGSRRSERPEVGANDVCTPAPNRSCLSSGVASPDLQTLLAIHKPKVAVIALGSNIAFDEATTLNLNSVRAMIQRVRSSGSACVWIGPPQACPGRGGRTQEQYDRFVASLQSEVENAGCSFVDSARPRGDGRSAYTDHANTTDCLHYRCSAATRWAESVANDHTMRTVLNGALNSNSHRPSATTPDRRSTDN